MDNITIAAIAAVDAYTCSFQNKKRQVKEVSRQRLFSHIIFCVAEITVCILCCILYINIHTWDYHVQNCSAAVLGSVVPWCNGQHSGLWIQRSEFKSRRDLYLEDMTHRVLSVQTRYSDTNRHISKFVFETIWRIWGVNRSWCCSLDLKVPQSKVQWYCQEQWNAHGSRYGWRL